MVTHDSTGFESGNKPYRWMCLRYVTFQEVASLKSVEELGVSGNIFSQLQEVQGAAGLWHFVIHNFCKNEEKRPVIVTAFFGSRLEILSAAVQEKFDLLDHDDDPRIIKTALSDADFTQLLYDYFMTGDVHNQKFFKTLATYATLSVLGGETLLHFCCERGLHNCVDYLLRHHSVLTAEKPWMRLADPLWQERKWGNSAFSIAAYRGDVQMLEILVSWAREHDQLQKVWQLKDKKNQDLFQVLQGRIAKGEGAKGNPKLAHNLLAEATGRRPLYGSQVSSLCPDVSSDEGATVLVDPPIKLGKSDASGALAEQRHTYRLDGKMTLPSLSAFFQTLREEDLQGKSVLIVNLKLLPQEDGKDHESAQDLLFVLRSCCRVSMKACFSNPELCIALAEAVAQQLNAKPIPAWESLGILPQWDEHPGGDSPLLDRFADALEKMSDAAEDTFQRGFIGFDLPQGVRSCVPWARVHVITLFGQAFTPKRLANGLRWGDRAEKLKANLSKNFKAFNCLLAGAAALERALLVKRTLLDSTSVEDALHPSWRWFVCRLICFWLKQVDAMTSRVSACQDSEMTAVTRQIELMLDGSVLHLVKMRPKKGRPGLSEICQVVEETLESNFSDWKTSLPEVTGYFRKIANPEAGKNSAMECHEP